MEMDIRNVVRIAKADHFGRTTPDALARQFPAGDWLLQRAAELDVLDQRPEPVIRGRDLIALGMKSGPAMGDLLDECFALQLEGEFPGREEALAWVKEKLAVMQTAGDGKQH